MERDLDELLVEAFQARQNELPELAQRLFTEALAQLPGDAALQIEIARCLVDRGLRSEARGGLREIDSFSEDPELQLELARIWRLAGAADEALNCYRQIRSGDEFQRQAVLEGALLEERLGRTDEALAWLPEKDNSAEATLARGVIAERQRDSSAAAAAYLKVRNLAGSSPMGIEAGYRLARLRLAEGNSRDAFALIAKVKAEEALGFSPGREALIRKQRSNEMALLEQWAKHPWPADEDAAPVWMVTGHPRSGTTLLARLLETRGLCWIDESPAFGALARQMSGQWLSQGSAGDLPGKLAALKPMERTTFGAAYRMRLADWGGAAAGSRLLDKNPGLWTMLPSVISLVPGWRSIVLLRDPRDVALSCYFQRFGNTPLGIACKTLEGAVAAVEHAYDHWLRLKPMLPESRCLEIRYEDLAADPEKTLGSPALQSWFSAPLPSPAPAASGSEAGRLLENPSYAQVAEAPHLRAVRRWEQVAGSDLKVLRTLDRIATQTGYE